MIYILAKYVEILKKALQITEIYMEGLVVDQFIRIKPLTPLWTGSEKRENEVLRETGILGSLRWWYEAVVRGLGGKACDPVGKLKCELNQEKFEKSLQAGKTSEEALKEQICPACRLFGCTGWGRKFRLEIDSDEIETEPKIRIRTRKKRCRTGREKYLTRIISGFLSEGDIIIKFIPLKQISNEEWVLLNKTLSIISDYGAIGARTSQGNGVIKIVENNLPYNREKINAGLLKKGSCENNLPNINNFFFYVFRLQFKDNITDLIKKKRFWSHQDDDNIHDNLQGWETLWQKYNFLPIAFHVRDAIRHLKNDRDNQIKIFGTLGKGSKVFVSNGYRIDNTDPQTAEVRIWGYDVEDSIKKEIKSELDSTLRKKLFSNGDFLQSCTLIKEKTGYELLEELL